MKFPLLEVMINYGIYTVKDLEKYGAGLLEKKNITILDECEKCACVYLGARCRNC